MDAPLSDVEVRVLGALVEKDITTPDYYPLSLNALINACNQKNNRDPVMTLDESAVREALGGVQERGFAGPASSADSRVQKYEHRLQEVFNFTRGEIAVLCVLLLRGPQTPGELRGRTERMHRFEDLDQVQSALHRLIEREPPLAAILPRQPGTKESRYAQLLGGDLHESQAPTPTQPERTTATAITNGDSPHVQSLKEAVDGLKQRISTLEEQFAAFRKQFE